MAFWIFQSMLNFSSYEDFFSFGKPFSDILKVCMKCFKRAKDNIAASTTTIKNEAENRWERGERKNLNWTAHNPVDKSLIVWAVWLFSSKEC